MVRRDSLLGRQIAEEVPRLLVVSSHARGSCEKRGSIVVRIDRRVDPLQHFFSILLGELIGVTRQTISQYEHDQISPGPAVMETITRVLRLPAEFFSFDARWIAGRPRFMRSMATTAADARKRAARRFEWLVAIGRHVEQFVKLPPPNLPNLDVPSRVDEISDEFIEGAAEAVRRHWKLGDGPISNVAWLLENNGVVIGQSRLWADKLDALSDWDDERSSSTLSDPQLTKPVFGLLHPLHVSRATDKQEPGKDFLYEGAGLRKGQRRTVALPHPFG